MASKPSPAFPAAYLVALLGLAPVAARAQAGAAPSGPPPQAVRTAVVERETIVERRRVTGELRAMRRSSIAAREPGLVLTLPVREGQRVAPGDVLATIDDARLQPELAGLRAERAVVDAQLVEQRAEVALRRWRSDALRALTERGSSFEQEQREAAAAIAVAEARVTQNERQLELLDARRALLQRRIDDTRITAPFAGVVLGRRTEVGGWVDQGGTVVDLIAVDRLEAWFEVPQDLAGAVQQEGAVVEMLLPGDEATVRAREFRVVPEVAADSRAFPLVVPLDNAGGALQAGMSATAWVPGSATVEHLLVPADAVLRSDVGSYVYVARGGGAGPPRATPVSLQVLFATGARYAVRADGLKAGEQVVVEGNERLFPQAPLAPRPAREN